MEQALIHVTGYRPFGNIMPDYKTVDRFNLTARKINENYVLPYEERKRKLSKLMNKFIKEATTV